MRKFAQSGHPGSKLLFQRLPSAGLVAGHAYSLTNVVVATTADEEEIGLIRIRNPWGNEVEWNGPWSDGSQEWDMISEESVFNKYIFHFLILCSKFNSLLVWVHVYFNCT
jgi:hypothetical protein